MAAHYDIWKANTGVRALQDSVMSYSVVFAICLCGFLCGTKAQRSSKDAGFQGINDVAVDFISHTTSSADDQSKWVWEPLGNERNTIKDGPSLPYFKHYSGSGDVEEPINATKIHKIWIFNETTEDTVAQSLKTSDRKRNKTEEKTYLSYERHLKQTNWCFKDTENTKLNSKFKVKRTFYFF